MRPDGEAHRNAGAGGCRQDGRRHAGRAGFASSFGHSGKHWNFLAGVFKKLAAFAGGAGGALGVMSLGHVEPNFSFWTTSGEFVFVAILVLFYFFDLSDVQSFVDRFGVWAPVVFVLTKAATIIFAPLSGSPLYPMAGALFGCWKGFFILMVGDILGGGIAFWISRKYGLKITKNSVYQFRHLTNHSFRKCFTIQI